MNANPDPTLYKMAKPNSDFTPEKKLDPFLIVTNMTFFIFYIYKSKF